MIALDGKAVVLKNQTFDLPKVVGGNATVSSQPDRLEPELALPLGQAGNTISGTKSPEVLL